MTRYFFTILICAFSARTFSQDQFVSKGELAAILPIEIKSGFMFVTLPIEDTTSDGTVATDMRCFLLDPAISNDGNYIPIDSNPILVTSTSVYRSPISDTRTLILNLVPTEARESFRKLKSNFMGVLGYGFLKRYRTVFDFSRSQLMLYSLSSEIEYTSEVLAHSTHTEYHDDAIINYCSCSFPSIWLDVKVPPIKEGRLHLSLADNQSLIFREALDPATLTIVEREEYADSLSGKNNFAGIQVGQFFINGTNIAAQNPKRAIIKRPAKFKDLNIEVIGTMAIDVIRTYHALIIDPVKNQLLLVK